MLSLRRISFLAKLSHAAQHTAFGFAAQRLPSRLFDQAKLGHVAPVYRSLIIKNMHSFSAQKQLGQADADYIKKLQEQVDFYLSVKDYDQARKVLMLITEFFLKKGYTGFEYAHTLFKIGMSYKHQEKQFEAMNYFERALSVYDSLEGNFEIDKAHIQLFIGGYFYHRQDYDQAERCLLKCAQIFQKTTTHRRQLLLALSFLGSINQHKQKYEDAIRFFATQLQILRQSSELKGLQVNIAIRSLDQMAKCFFQTGKFGQALASSLQAQRLYESEGLQKSNEYAVHLIKLANIHRSLNQQQQFFHCCEKALAIQSQFLDKDKPGFLNLLLELGSEYFSAKKLDQAFPHFQRYLSIQDSLPKEKKDSRYADALLVMAIIHRDKDNCTKALKYFKQSLEIKEKDGPLDNAALILKLMTEMYLHLKDFASSLDCAFKWLGTNVKLYGEKSSKNAEILSVISIIYQLMGNQAESLKFIEMAQSVLGDQTKAENK